MSMSQEIGQNNADSQTVEFCLERNACVSLRVHVTEKFRKWLNGVLTLNKTWILPLKCAVVNHPHANYLANQNKENNTLKWKQITWNVDAKL